jgi:hypothetical protein
MFTRQRFAWLIVVLVAVVTLGAAIAWRRATYLDWYEAAVREIAAAPARSAEFEQKYHCHIEPGTPLRVAFVQPGSLLDNWEAIVYDPSGEVLKASRFKSDLSNFDDPDLQSVKKLFGGDLSGVEPLGGHWYWCSFT